MNSLTGKIIQRIFTSTKKLLGTEEAGKYGQDMIDKFFVKNTNDYCIIDIEKDYDKVFKR